MNRPKPARFAEWLFAVYSKIRFGVPDPLCGMKAYRMDLYDKLGHFDTYDSVGTELMLFALRSGARFKIVPIPVQERVDEPRFGQFSANLKILKALWRGMRR